MLAALWPAAEPRGEEHYWLSRYVRYTPFEVWSDVPAEHVDRVLAAKHAIEAHPLVAALVED